MPIRPIKPEPNSQAAAGMGTVVHELPEQTVSALVPKENFTLEIVEALVTPLIASEKVALPAGVAVPAGEVEVPKYGLKLLLAMPSVHVGIQ
jgi:hypothetical protein